MTDGNVTARKVTEANFADLARLFEAKGGPAYCWCHAWRQKPKALIDGPADARRAAGRAAMQKLVGNGIPIGLLAYDQTELVGWCSVAPRETFIALGGPEAPEGTVWSIVCFYVPRLRRGEGITRTLLKAAIDEAREAGAEWIEAYPVDPNSPSYRFMGFVPFFQDAGFAETGMAGKRRHVMRLGLR